VLVALKSRGGPLLLRFGRGITRGAKLSLAATQRASAQGYAWLKPRAISAAHTLAEKARKARHDEPPKQLPAEADKGAEAELVAAASEAPDSELPASQAASELSSSSPEVPSASERAPETRQQEEGEDAVAATVLDRPAFNIDETIADPSEAPHEPSDDKR
jgi:hypothetical protein